MDPLRSATNFSPTFVVIDACLESPQFRARDQISDEWHKVRHVLRPALSSQVDAGFQFSHSNAAPQRGWKRWRQLWVKGGHAAHPLSMSVVPLDCCRNCCAADAFRLVQ